MLNIKRPLTLIASLLVLVNCSEGQAPLAELAEPSQSQSAFFDFDKILHSAEKPSSMPSKADFNGDGLADKVFWGQRNLSVSESSVTPANLWPQYTTVTVGSLHAIGISFGGGLGHFLIYDVNDISALDTSAALSAEVIQHKNIGLIEDVMLNEKAKGDVIVIPTEAGIDTYIFWNGLTFELFEPLDYP